MIENEIKIIGCNSLQQVGNQSKTLISISEPTRSAPHVIIMHGYLLSGSGSCAYTLNVAKEWKKHGFGVTIICQDLNAKKYEFIDEYHGPEIAPSEIEKLDAPKGNQCRVVVPNIDCLLPVYNYQKYEGFKVKTVPNCTLDEIENYIRKTSAYLRHAALGNSFRLPANFVLTNHVLFGPVIAARALSGLNIPYSCKIHGSALTVSLQPYPRLLPYAIEGLQHCSQIFAGTSHIVKLMYELFGKGLADSLDFKSKMTIVPPGIDATVFKPIYESMININMISFKKETVEYISSYGQGRNSTVLRPFDDISSLSHFEDKHFDKYHDILTARGYTYNQMMVDFDLLSRFPTLKENEPIIMYVGNFLNIKGVGEILISFLGRGGILECIPSARLICVGYGGYREHMESMIDSMINNDENQFILSSNAGHFVDQSVILSSYFREITVEEASRVTITGMLQQSQLSLILPLASLLILGSKCSEAFGMVIIEAMSCGVLPLANYHSGIIDVVDEVKESDIDIAEMMMIKTQPGGYLNYADGGFFIQQLIPKIRTSLSFLYPFGFDNHKTRFKVGRKLREIAVSRFSWDKIAMRLLEMARKNE
jgi:glycosyltransferase involved in cell wall biosynthesis